MCGPFIHGRSWIENEEWQHFCKPMEVNSHHEMPEATCRHRVSYENAMMLMEKSDEFSRGNFLGCQTVYISEMIPPFHPIMANQLISDQRVEIKETRFNLEEISGIETRIIYNSSGHRGPGIRERVYDIILKKKDGAAIDWGIKPWDGKVAKQRGNLTEELKTLITQLSFMPTTQSDLIGWVNKHWGKLGDESEFIDEMPKCLDGEKLAPNLPGFTGNRWVKAKLMAGGGFKVVGSQSDISLAIMNARNPVDRFVEMFKEAPNNYWQGRN